MVPVKLNLVQYMEEIDEQKINKKDPFKKKFETDGEISIN